LVDHDPAPNLSWLFYAVGGIVALGVCYLALAFSGRVREAHALLVQARRIFDTEGRIRRSQLRD
jgi:hypothetical protein